MKSRILFVDDVPNVLSGLRRMLKRMRSTWDMTFTDSARKAIALMQDHDFDVVVTDMRMPDMDGAELLTIVRQQHPGAVRIILSGYAEEETVLRTVGPAHQYLAKPCDASVLIDTIDRTLALRRFLHTKDLVALISGLERLPSPPAIFSRLLHQLESPQSARADIAATIAQDLAMSAQTLKLINSAYFSLPQKIHNLDDAVRLLGTHTLKSLVLIAGFYKEFSGDAKTAATIEKLSRRCLSIAMVAGAIAKAEGYSIEIIDQATSAGVLSHIGTLALIENEPQRFAHAMDLIEKEGLNIIEAERRVFGAAHPEIGAYLLGLWGFSNTITEAVAYHHSPRQFPSRTKPPVLICVHIAQHLARTIKACEADDEDVCAGAALDVDTLRELGLEDKMPQWIERVRELKNKAEGSGGE